MNFLLRFITSFLIFSAAFTIVAQNVAIQKQDTFARVDTIMIDADFCAVKISGHESNDIKLSAVIKTDENQDQYKIDTEVAQSKLSVSVVKPASWKSHWGEIVVKLPEGLNVVVVSKSGKVEVESLSVQNINIDSKSGHVNMTGVKGNVQSSSPAGDIVVDNYEGDLRSKSKSGKVILRNVKGDFFVSSNKGDFSISQLKGNLKTDGGSGFQEIENVEGNISAKTTNGDIKISLVKGNIETRTFEGNQKVFQSEAVYNLHASSGSITGTRIKFTGSSTFTTSEGNIKVQMNTKSDLAFVLKSDNSFLRAMGKSKKKSLKVGKGSIVITGTSTTGSQAYY